MNATEDKKPLTCLYRDNPETPEGKYHVQRRDGTTVEWPSFVLGARDPDGSETFRFYALLKLLPERLRQELINKIHEQLNLWLSEDAGQNKGFVASALKWAGIWDEYRKTHGDGDPLMGRHRPDDPETIAKMRKGMSA